MSKKLRVVGLSDACIGYGSPQITSFINSLQKYYDAEGIIIEPDDWSKPQKYSEYSNIMIKRILSNYEPYTESSRIDYNIRAAQEIDKLKPDILVVFCTYCLPALFKINFKPKYTIYYAIESIIMYGEFDVKMNRYISDKIDLVIFPEENRARKDGERCNLLTVPKVILYNVSCSDIENKEVVPSNMRNGKILNSGTIGKEYTFAHYYLEKKLQNIPIDLYGQIVGYDAPALKHSFENLDGNVKYKGCIDLDTLNKIRKKYSYSIVIWTPEVERGLYAPSNKFFEAIQDGVPPITAPHPQHKMLVERYDCGIIMKDWSFNAFFEAINQAIKICGTNRYNELISNCLKAKRLELNWECQFEKVKRHLKKIN